MFSLENILPPVFGYLIGFFFSFITSGPGEGKEGVLKNIYISLGSRTILLHHWIYSVVIVTLLVCIQAKFKFIPPTIFLFIISFLLGVIVQGLIYNDWYKVVVR